VSVFCKDLNLLYLANPHAASTSIIHFLKKNYDGIDTSKKHSSLSDLFENPLPFTLREIREAFVVTSVRNPYDLIATSYYMERYKVHTGGRIPADGKYASLISDSSNSRLSVLEFLSGKVIGKTVERQWQFVEGVDDIIVFELGVQLEVDRILDRLGVKNAKQVPHRNKINGKDYRPLYGKREKQQVVKLAREWLDHSGYSFDGFNASKSRLLKDLRGRK